MNAYYDVSLKDYRLKELDAMVPEGINYKFVKGSIADKALVDKLFGDYKFDVVVNLAAQAGVRYSIENPDVYFESNIIGFYNILEACRHNPVEHLVYASSSSVYGGNKKVPFAVEDRVDNPVSLYAATKKSNELFAHCYSKLYNIPSTGLRFFTVYGPAGRSEICVNSICHRDYSILGTDIQVKLFDDHITVESPGILPGLVRPYNIREMHFSRNPKIALYMRSYKLVKEFGEGVDRMFREMAEARLPAPEYRQNEFMVYATIRQHGDAVGQLNGQLNGELNGELNASQKATLQFIIEHEGCTASGISEMTKIPFSTIDKHVRVLLKVGMIERRGSKKTGGYYPVTKK